MGWTVGEMNLPPDEARVAENLVNLPGFRQFIDWVETVLAGAPGEREVYTLADLIGKVLIFAGENLRRGSRESLAAGGDDWDGSKPEPRFRDH